MYTLVWIDNNNQDHHDRIEFGDEAKKRYDALIASGVPEEVILLFPPESELTPEQIAKLGTED